MHHVFFSASMGPCLFRHGNIFALGYSFMAIRFNGAVPFQARKFYAEIKHIENSDASMGPCLFRHGNISYFSCGISGINSLQWGRAFSGTEIKVVQKSRYFKNRFNGAVPFQARKWWESIVAFFRSIWASMGPCLFRHGNCESTPYPKRRRRLQWGRAFSGTEIIANSQKCDRIRYASMGPCFFRHGNCTITRVIDGDTVASMGPCLFQARKSAIQRTLK